MKGDRAETEKEMRALGAELHPTEDDLVALAEGQVIPAARKKLVVHLDGCADCRAILAALAEDATPADALIGQSVGGFRIEGFVSKGAMGAVYLATKGTQSVAIKVLLREAEEDQRHVVRMRSEARVLTGLEHPNVVKVHGYAELTDGRPCLIMEYLDGEPLNDRIRRKPPGLRACLVVIDQLLAGLEACHAHDVIHRDLKPANVLVLESPRGPVVKLIDFGFSKHRDATAITSPRSLLGSAGYLAPELLSGDKASASSDLYAVGCIAWRMITGNVVFPGASSHPLEILRRHATETPPKLRAFVKEAPEALERWMDQMLAKTPATRVKSATLARDLLDFAKRELDATVIEHTPARGGKLLIEPASNPTETNTEQPRSVRVTRSDRPSMKTPK